MRLEPGEFSKYAELDKLCGKASVFESLAKLDPARALRLRKLMGNPEAVAAARKRAASWAARPMRDFWAPLAETHAGEQAKMTAWLSEGAK